MPLPSATLWEQYSILGVLFLMLLFIGLGVDRFWKLWEANREREYQRQKQREDEQDARREAEREKQRLWQEQQNIHAREEAARQNALRDADVAKRDQMWRDFFERMQAQENAQINALVSQMKEQKLAMGEVVTQLGRLTVGIERHDSWAKEAIRDIRDDYVPNASGLRSTE